MTDWTKKWDDHEKRLDQSDIDPEGPKIEVQVHADQVDNEVPLSGLFCVWCHDYAIHIFEGNSLCHECFNKEIKARVKK